MAQIREMSGLMERNVLVVCSDDRATDLARVLADSFSIFRLRWVQDTDRWAWSKWKKNAWAAVEDPESTKISVLFFHTGQNVPTGIPKDREFDNEFAFSGGKK